MLICKVRSDKFRQAAYGILSCLPLRGGVRSGGVRRVYAEGVTARLVTPDNGRIRPKLVELLHLLQ
jgi:hypothetical protein